MNDKQQQQPYPLRMSSDLREALEYEAKNSRRSLHAEIISRLEKSLSGADFLVKVFESDDKRNATYIKKDAFLKDLAKTQLQLTELIKILSGKDHYDIDKKPPKK